MQVQNQKSETEFHFWGEKKGGRDINLASAKYLGALDMLSIPPATMTSLIPNWILCDASIIAAMTNKMPTDVKMNSQTIKNRNETQERMGEEKEKTSFMLPFSPDAQTLLTVVQTTEFGIPAPNAACLAGACPRFALRTLPKKTSCTSDGSTFALLRAAVGDKK